MGLYNFTKRVFILSLAAIIIGAPSFANNIEDNRIAGLFDRFKKQPKVQEVQEVQENPILDEIQQELPSDEVIKEYVGDPGLAPSPSTTPIQNAVHIKEIQILGTNSIQPEYVKSKMVLQAGDIYDRNFVQQDLKNIYELGYFTEKMKAIPVENPDNTVTLKIVLEENVPVTDFTIEGNTVISTDELLTYLLPLRGKPQNIAQLNIALEQLQECYASKGYILARISSLYDDPDGTINIEVNEGVINKIMISGNEKTKSYVIERNIMTEPGTIYKENRIREDIVRLYSTQSFKEVNREIEPSEDDPTKFDVTVVVKEQRTAAISLGGGLDSATGVFGSIGLSDNNFRGLNQRVGINALVGSGVIMSDSSIKSHMNLQGEISFFEPYFLNADNSFMSKIFFRDLGSYQVPLAVEQRFGIEGTVAHKVRANKHLTTTFSTSLENIKVKEGDFNTISNLYKAYNVPISERAKQLEGGFFLTLSPGVIYDTRDTMMNPRHGVLATARFDESLCINGFDKTNGRLSGMIKKYFPVAKKSSFTLTARAGGKIHGDEMPEVMAYRLGGPYTIRGYRVNGVGTGTGFVMGSAEFATPIPFTDKLKILNI